jgi:ABC-type transport system involved in multi-copper enzyme maturation permease subunit
MAVYKRTYKAYAGRLTPEWSRFTVISRYAFASLFDSRPFTAYCVLCCVPFLVGIAFIYIIHTPSVQGLLNVRFGEQLRIDRSLIVGMLAFQCGMGFILTAWGAPGMITKDFANHAVQLYLSRPLSRTEYVLGKAAVLISLLSVTTWIPTLILFFLHGGLEGNGWLWKNLWLASSIITGGMLWVLVITLYSMALSVWVKWRIAASGLMFATFFLMPALGEAVNAILRTEWGRLMNLPYTISVIWSHLFGLDSDQLRARQFDRVPLWSAWATVLGVCAFSLWLLNRRLKAREVERG